MADNMKYQIKKTGEAAKNAASTVGKKIKVGADKVAQKTADVAEAAGNAVKKAGQAIKEKGGG